MKTTTDLFDVLAGLAAREGGDAPPPVNEGPCVRFPAFYSGSMVVSGATFWVTYDDALNASGVLVVLDNGKVRRCGPVASTMPDEVYPEKTPAERAFEFFSHEAMVWDAR